MKTTELATRGVEAAKKFLERRGYVISAVDWNCKAGQIDLVAIDDDTIVFTEVKTRKDTNEGFASDALTAEKRDRLERIAASWLKKNAVTDTRVRFDIISILVLGPNKAFLRHHINAFGEEPIE